MEKEQQQCLTLSSYQLLKIVIHLLMNIECFSSPLLPSPLPAAGQVPGDGCCFAGGDSSVAGSSV